MRTWEFTKKSKRQFIKLDSQAKKRIISKLDFWVESGDPLRFAEGLTNSELGEYRFRVGDYRVIFDVEGEKIVVLAVGHRREIYK